MSEEPLSEERQADADRRWQIAKTEFVAQLCAGVLVARGMLFPADHSSRLVVIPADHWHILRPDWDRDSAAAEGGLKYTAIRVTSREEIEKWEAIEAGRSKGSKGSKGSNPTARMRDAAIEWIKREAKQGASPKRENAFLAAQLAIPGLPRKTFLAAWKKAAPDAWKVPGRRSAPKSNPRRD